MQYKLFGKKYPVEGILMLLPILLLYGIVIIYPLFNMVYTSFFEWSGIVSVPYKFVGLDNYIAFFTDFYTMTAFKNILILIVTGVIFTIPISFFLATVINKKFFGLRAVKTFYFLPVVINRVAIGLMFTFIFFPQTGPFPVILSMLGIANNVNILGNINTAMWGVAFVNTWNDAGFQMIIFSSGMASIPDDIYEAAEIDGVTPWQKLIYITLPMMKSTFKIVLVFILTGAFKVFDLIMALTSGGPGSATQVPSTLLYKNAFTFSKFGYADSIAVLTVVLCLLITYMINHFFRTKSA